MVPEHRRGSPLVAILHQGRTWMPPPSHGGYYAPSTRILSMSGGAGRRLRPGETLRHDVFATAPNFLLPPAILGRLFRTQPATRLMQTGRIGRFHSRSRGRQLGSL